MVPNKQIVLDVIKMRVVCLYNSHLLLDYFNFQENYTIVV